MKKRQKAREVAAKKSQKVVVRPAPKKKEADVDEAELNPNQYFEIRSRAINQMKTTSTRPYPHKFQINSQAADFIAKWSHLKTGEEQTDEKICIGLRVMQTRASGNHLRFYDCKAEGKIWNIWDPCSSLILCYRCCRTGLLRQPKLLIRYGGICTTSQLYQERRCYRSHWMARKDKAKGPTRGRVVDFRFEC